MATLAKVMFGFMIKYFNPDSEEDSLTDSTALLKLSSLLIDI